MIPSKDVAPSLRHQSYSHSAQATLIHSLEFAAHTLSVHVPQKIATSA